MSGGLGAMKGMLRRIWTFLSSDVWDVELSSLSMIRRFGVDIVRVVHLVAKGFKEDQCPLHASALTFSTLMSIVPILAVSLALAKGLGVGEGIDEDLKSWVRGKLIAPGTERIETASAAAEEEAGAEAAGADAAGGQEDVGSAQELVGRIETVIDGVFDSVRNISFAKLGGIGLIILVWSVVQVLGRVESSFNIVWGVATGRPIHRKVFDYLGMLIVLPLLAMASSSLPIASMVTKHLAPDLARRVNDFLLSGALRAVMVATLTTVTFAFLIMFMPNTRVRLRAGLAGGFTSAVLFLGWLWLCVAIQVGVAGYSRIYGSFAAVPIVLFWVLISWEIILLGAEVAFAVQNCETYRMETRAHSASARAKCMLALSVVKEAALRMLEKKPGFDAAEYARGRSVPVRLLNDVLQQLGAAGVMGELSENPGCYALLRSPNKLSVKDVLTVIQRSGAGPGEFGLGASLDPGVARAMASAEAGMDAAVADLTIERLAAEA